MDAHRVGLSILVSFVALATACRAKEPATAEKPSATASGAQAAAAPPAFAAAPTAAPPAVAAPAAGVLAPTDDELMAYLVWGRDWKQLANRNKAELDAVAEQAAAKLSFKDTDKLAQDPELLAVIDRQTKAMKAHLDLAPRGPMVEAFKAAISGIGSMVPRPDGWVWVSRRDESVLAAARQRYGDEFVGWVLAREATIVATFSE